MPGSPVPAAAPAPTRQQVLAFRAHRHGLAERRPAEDLLAVVGAVGVQDTPPGSADVALAARLDLARPVVEEAVAERRLVLTWSLRGAPHLVAPADLPTFTLGALPAAGTRAALWRQPEEALEVVEQAMVDALGGPLAKGELSRLVTAAVPAALAPWCRPCQAPHPSESVFRAAPLLGRIVLTRTAPVVLARATWWLGADAVRPAGDPDHIEQALLRRYLRCYAPTTPGHFAAWAGIATADARRRWQAVAGDLVRVGSAFALAEDLDDLLHPAPVEGVRLLPPKDAWLQARDRDLLYDDPAERRRAFPTLGGPGVVLVDGAPAGVWRAAARGRRLAVRWRPFDGCPPVDLEPEAARVAAVRGLGGAVLEPWT